MLGFPLKVSAGMTGREGCDIFGNARGTTGRVAVYPGGDREMGTILSMMLCKFSIVCDQEAERSSKQGPCNAEDPDVVM
jgi:hypothetical protein